MAGMDPRAMAQTIGTGLLSFPVTHFDADNRFNEAAYRDHRAWMLEKPLAGLFAAVGTGGAALSDRGQAGRFRSPYRRGLQGHKAGRHHLFIRHLQLPAGPVRTPLIDLSEAELAELTAMIARIQPSALRQAA